MTKFDKILISVSVFAFNLIWMIYFVENIAVAIFIAVLLTVLLISVGLHLLNRKEDKSRISITEMENLFALYGNEFQVSLLKRATPEYFNPEIIENGITFNQNCQKVAAFINYKYSPISAEDLAKFYRQAKKQEVGKIYVLTRPAPRNVLVLAASLDVEFIFITSRQLHKYLYRQNLLMEKIKKVKIKRPKRKFSEVFAEIFQKRRAKYFFFCALTFSLFLIVSPYKIYYIIMLSLVLCMGVACLVRRA